MVYAEIFSITLFFTFLNQHCQENTRLLGKAMHKNKKMTFLSRNQLIKWAEERGRYYAVDSCQKFLFCLYPKVYILNFHFREIDITNLFVILRLHTVSSVTHTKVRIIYLISVFTHKSVRCKENNSRGTLAKKKIMEKFAEMRYEHITLTSYNMK